MQRPIAIDLFSGCEGMSLGLETPDKKHKYLAIFVDFVRLTAETTQV